MTGDAVSPLPDPSPVYGSPSVPQLLEAVIEFIERDAAPQLADRSRFHARVAVNVLRTIAREWELGPADAEAHAMVLARLGVSSEAGLSEAIRAGAFDEDRERLRAALAELVSLRLRVNNPRYLHDTPAP